MSKAKLIAIRGNGRFVHDYSLEVVVALIEAQKEKGNG